MVRRGKVNSVGCKNEYFSKNIANTRHLKRILIYLSVIKEMVTITQIKEYIGIKLEYIRDGLAFLTGQNLILTSKHNNVNYYFINPLFQNKKDKINFAIGR